MKTRFWKRAFAMVAVICMMTAMLPVDVNAASEIVGSGQMGDNVYWTLDKDGLLTVSGTGPTWDYIALDTERVNELDAKEWDLVYSGGKRILPKRIVIEEGVTTIGSCLFGGRIDDDWNKVEEVSLPSSVFEIKDRAFFYCSKLTEVNFSVGLSVIGSRAFGGTGLKNVVLPDGIKAIGSEIFARCKDLESVVIPDGVEAIEHGSFVSCYDLNRVWLPKSISKIDYAAFGDCKKLKDVYYGGSELQWTGIEVDNFQKINDTLLESTIHYNAGSYNDTPSSWAETEVGAAVNAGLVPDKLRANYKSPISRGWEANMLVALIEKSTGKTIDEYMMDKGLDYDLNAFSDTTSKSVLAAHALGIINGTDGKRFEPEGFLTRAQIAAIINREANLLGISTRGFSHDFTDVRGHWVNDELGWPVSAGIINGVGNGKFDPDTRLTTEQAIVITYRAFRVFTGK